MSSNNYILASWQGVTSNTLQEVDVDIRPNTVCEQQYPNFSSSINICAGKTAGGKDSCQVKITLYPKSFFHCKAKS